MKLSIIIPVFNEERTIGLILERVTKVAFKGIQKEIIVVDDGSIDKTVTIVKTFIQKHKNVIFIQHNKNQGKGAAVKTAINQATGEYIIIQDADLEYDPKDIFKLLEPIQNGTAKVVYGTRLKRLPNLRRDERNVRFLIHYLGNKFLSLVTSGLYLQWLTDIETCYKLFPRAAMADITLHAKGFELEPEITAKLLKKNYKIIEVPISTNPRGKADGKKLNTIRDGLKAFSAIVRYRFSD
jgi:dolichol-phosphate mannosyltransferase